MASGLRSDVGSEHTDTELSGCAGVFSEGRMCEEDSFSHSIRQHQSNKLIRGAVHPPLYQSVHPIIYVQTTHHTTGSRHVRKRVYKCE